MHAYTLILSENIGGLSLLATGLQYMSPVCDPFSKMAAKASMGQIWDAPIAKYIPNIMAWLCAKPHTFIIKRTIHLKICTYLLY